MPPGISTGGNSRFSCTVRLAKIPRSSGQYATPRRAISSGAKPWMDRPVDADVAVAPLDQPHDGAQRGRLAGAVAADQTDDLAAMHVEVHVVQRLSLSP
jgi:hypothetical protein